MYLNQETQNFILRLKGNKMTFGLKYKEAAKEIGISADFLYHIVAGRRNLPKEYWERAEQYLNNFEK